jgi:hypothetical protein
VKRSWIKRGTKRLARRTPLPQVSAKRAKVNRERSAMIRELWPDGAICIVPWCSTVAEDPHEPWTRARGGPIDDPDNVVPTCRRHNEKLTEEPDWGYELDLLIASTDKRTLAQQAADRRRKIAAAELELIEQRGLESEWAREAS